MQARGVRTLKRTARRAAAGFGIGAWLALVCSGCNPGNSPASFRLNSQNDNLDNYREVGDETETEKKDKAFNIEGRQYVADALEAMFGTPDRPFVFRESGLDLRKLRTASGPVDGLPPSVRDADLKTLNERLAEVKKQQAQSAEAVKDHESRVLTNLSNFAASKGLTNVKTPTDLKEQEPAFREQFKSVLDAKTQADAASAAAAGEAADLELVIKSYLVPQKGLYRKHCAHCHGTTGDGAGPTAAFLNPHPRDYRQGIFKFKSTERAAKPTVADLRRIIVDGIPDTAMPSFALLPPDEIDALVEYVKYLSIRGEAETALKARLFEDRKMMTPSRSELVKVALKEVAASWNDASSAQIKPVEGYKPDADRDAWLKGGAELFAGQKGQCYTCHGTTGLGDGRKKSEPLFDIWNKSKEFGKFDDKIAGIRKNIADLQADEQMNSDAKKEAVRTAEKNIAALTNQRHSWLLPEQEQMPRNLRQGRFRFGRRPIDLYYRIYAGINGTEMPGGGPPSPGAQAKLTEKEIWQLVDYVQALPYFDEHGRLPKPGEHGPAHAPAGQPPAGHAEAAGPRTGEPSGGE